MTRSKFGMPMKLIVGSDIAHCWRGSVDCPVLAWLLSGSIPGIILGSYLSAHIPDAVLRPMLAAVHCIVGGRLVF
jgi:uncharacterized protein